MPTRTTAGNLDDLWDLARQAGPVTTSDLLNLQFISQLGGNDVVLGYDRSVDGLIALRGEMIFADFLAGRMVEFPDTRVWIGAFRSVRSRSFARLLTAVRLAFGRSDLDP